MLNDQRRKRTRQALAAVARAPPTMRRSNALLAPPQAQTGRSADSRILAALPRFSDAQPPPHYPRQQQPLWTRRSAFAAVELPTTTVAAELASDSAALVALRPTPRTDHVDVRKLIRHAHRAQKLLLDRLTVVNMRRNHRCELANEIARLKRVLATLQAQVDTTTRNVAAMDRLVQHLQQVSSIFHDGTSEQRRPERVATADSEALTLEGDTLLATKSSSGDDTTSLTTECQSTSRIEPIDSSCLNHEPEAKEDEAVATDEGRTSDDVDSTATDAKAPSQDLGCEDESSSSSDVDRDATRAE